MCLKSVDYIIQECKMKPAVLSIAVLAVCTVSVSSQWCATYHQLTHVFTRVLLCFSMHVGVKTSVNVVTTVVICFSMWNSRHSECSYATVARYVLAYL